MTAHGAPQIDEYGNEHAWGCPMTDWHARASRVPGFVVLTCSGCDVVRIATSSVARPGNAWAGASQSPPPYAGSPWG